MRRSKKRKRKSGGVQEEVELNMAAMLDMAFQLLAFFILTFKPSEVEAQISMRMPKEKAVTQGSTVNIEIPKEEVDSESFALPLDIKVYANREGSIERVTIGAHEFRDSSTEGFYPSVTEKVASIVGMPGCDGIRVTVSEFLKYEYLMQIVDICARQTLPSGDRMTKISISSMQ